MDVKFVKLLETLEKSLKSLNIKYTKEISKEDNGIVYICHINKDKAEFAFTILISAEHNILGFLNKISNNVKMDKLNEILLIINERNIDNAMGTVYLSKEEKTVWCYIGISVEGNQICLSLEQIKDYILDLLLVTKEVLEELDEKNLIIDNN